MAVEDSFPQPILQLRCSHMTKFWKWDVCWNRGTTSSKWPGGAGPKATAASSFSTGQIQTGPTTWNHISPDLPTGLSDKQPKGERLSCLPHCYPVYATEIVSRSWSWPWYTTSLGSRADTGIVRSAVTSAHTPGQRLPRPRKTQEMFCTYCLILSTEWGGHPKSHVLISDPARVDQKSPCGVFTGEPAWSPLVSNASQEKPSRIILFSLLFWRPTVNSADPFRARLQAFVALLHQSPSSSIFNLPGFFFRNFLSTGNSSPQILVYCGLFLPFKFLSCHIKWGLGRERSLSHMVIWDSTFTTKGKKCLCVCVCDFLWAQQAKPTRWNLIRPKTFKVFLFF